MAEVQQQRRNMVVIGGSAGALDPLRSILSKLPADFPASILVVIHRASDAPNSLPRILGNSSPLPCHTPTNEEKIREGNVYIAPPDFHLLVEKDRIMLSHGPRENRHRPAIDPLFRTAARWHGEQVIGVILSGQLDDGSSGLMAVRMRGGVAIAQDARDAEAPDMPEHASRYAQADYVRPASEIAGLLISLVNEPVAAITPAGGRKMNVSKSRKDPASLKTDNDEGDKGIPSEFSCPECQGVLWERPEGELMRFRCRVGHAYTGQALLEELTIRNEDALWAAMRVLDEKAALLRRLARTSPEQLASRYSDEAEGYKKHAQTIREILLQMGKTEGKKAEAAKSGSD